MQCVVSSHLRIVACGVGDGRRNGLSGGVCNGFCNRLRGDRPAARRTCMYELQCISP
jgi:hypothetical protein